MKNPRRRDSKFPLAHRTDLPAHERAISTEALASLDRGLAEVRAGKVARVPPTLTRSAKIIQRVLHRLLDEEYAFLRIHRVRAGHHQRSAGAWSWYAVDATGDEVIGSQWPVSAFAGREAPASIHVNRVCQRE